MDDSYKILNIEVSFDRIRALCVVLVGFQISYSIFEFTYHHFVSLWIKKPVVFEKQGNWAVIAGCVSGLGRAFIEDFAKRKMDIVLIDRNENELGNIAAFVKEKYDVKTVVIPSNFAPIEVTYKKIYKHILDLDIGVLVLNLHEMQTRPSLLAQQDEDINMEAEIERLVDNCDTITQLLHLFLPGMYFRSKGVIILVSSLLVTMPAPMLSITSACNAYCVALVRNIRGEVEGRVSLRILTPGPLHCRWLRLREPSLLAPSPIAYLRTAMPLVARHEETTGYWAHDFVGRVVGFIEGVNCDFAGEGVMQCMELLRGVSIRGYL